MTLPVIHTKIQRSVLNNQFKKTYSVLSSALQKASFDMDNSVACYYLLDGTAPEKKDDCNDFFYNALAKNLKVVKTCNKNSYENGCMPDYDWEKISNGCASFSSDAIKKNGALVLNDGSILFLYADSFPYIGFDVNGKKGPNKPGLDVYSLTIRQSSGALKFAAYSGDKELIVAGCLPTKGVTYISEIMKY